MKKIIGILIYLITVVSFILLADNIVGLTTNEAFYILVLALILLVIFLYIFQKKLHICIRWSGTDVHGQRMKNVRRLIFKKKVFIFMIPVVAFFSYIKIKETANIPDYLIEFGEKYPEAFDFVNEYPQKKDRHYTIDLKNEVAKGTIPLFIQWDNRWGYENYGNNLIGTAGCGPTCLSMVICGLTGNTKADPLTVARFSEKQGYYIDGEGTSWNLMTEGAQFWGIDVETGMITEDYILENLTQNNPIICSRYPGDFTYTGHFIVLTGIDLDGNIIIHDSNSYIKSEKHWNLEIILPQIRALWTYSEL